VVAAKVQDMIGSKVSLETAEKMGITSLVKERTAGGLNDYTRSIALGGLTNGVSALDMAVAYGTIANRGIKVDPITILRVEDKNGSLLLENKTNRSLVISEESSYLMTSMLRDVVSGGTGTAANIGRPAAGKTGTTSDWKDAWFAGFTPDTVGIVWMGFDQNKTMQQWKITGGSYPALIWGRMMKEIVRDEAPSDFPIPDNMVSAKICKKTGELPSPACPASDIVTEIFPKGKEPTSLCTYPHGR
jgi:penicillin-binding protein 1A